ncbi:unnamed protein product [Adineta steineri]|uniref:Uncharacterized protein n=1 Tax=Adineta steineri TaxID=433720 RepID=A0A815LCH3_9BILA|nr:unnamed protein product [Adineta steineri]CAF1407961.1 unnamed protein product [Adineta steineri]
MTQTSQQLQIIAQPKALYRERYGTEQNKIGNRVQRYIRAEDNQLNLEYPTIEIPREWRDVTVPLYICVTSVTVPNDMESIVCVHPYPLDTDDSNVKKNSDNNALYFPITNNDYINGRKSFLITRKKLVQSALKLYGPLRIVDSGQSHILGMIKKSRGKHLIETYKLWKSQLVFSRAERDGNGVFNILTNSSVSSQVMSEEINQQPYTVAPVVTPINNDEKWGRCAPKKGDWTGGDEVLMVLPKLNQRKRLYIYFDYEELNQKTNIQYELIDMKTIAFQTPACLMDPNGQDRTVSIVAEQDEKVIAKFNFLYLSRFIEKGSLWVAQTFDRLHTLKRQYSTTKPLGIGYEMFMS